MKMLAEKLPFRLCVFVWVSLCWSTALFAQGDESGAKSDPIDQQVDKLMNVDPSTGGMVQALAKGEKLWDAEMNKAYRELMTLLPANEKEALKKAQRDWLVFRDSNLALSRAVYGHAQGSMYRPMATGDEMEVVKTRAKQLRTYLEVMRDSKEN